MGHVCPGKIGGVYEKKIKKTNYLLNDRYCNISPQWCCSMDAPRFIQYYVKGSANNKAEPTPMGHLITRNIYTFTIPVIGISLLDIVIRIFIPEPISLLFARPSLSIV